jgi:hypothetical protein
LGHCRPGILGGVVFAARPATGRGDEDDDSDDGALRDV